MPKKETDVEELPVLKSDLIKTLENSSTVEYLFQNHCSHSNAYLVQVRKQLLKSFFESKDRSGIDCLQAVNSILSKRGFSIKKLHKEQINELHK